MYFNSPLQIDFNYYDSNKCGIVTSLIIYGILFVGELGDKTQILTITLSSFYIFPIEVWLGAFLALVSVAWIGILFGAFNARKVPKFYLKVISTSIFIFLGILILITSL